MRLSGLPILCVVIFMLASYSAFTATPKKGSSTIVVAGIRGGDHIKLMKSSGRFNKIREGQKLRRTNRIATDKYTVATIKIGDDWEIQLGKDSELQLLNVKPASRDFKLVRGALMGKWQNPTPIGALIVRDPTAILDVKGTEFMLIYDPKTTRSEAFAIFGEHYYSKSKLLEKKTSVMIKEKFWSHADSKIVRPTVPQSFPAPQKMRMLFEQHGFKGDSVTVFLPPPVITEAPKPITMEACKKRGQGWRHRKGLDPHLGDCYE